MFTHAVRAVPIVAGALWLASCADTAPTSPTAVWLRSPVFASKSLQPRIEVELRGHAKRLEDGSIRVTLRAHCPSGFRVVEGPISVIQGPEFGEIFGEGFFTTPCDGRWHQSRVRVVAPDGLQTGTATASATLMVEHPETAEFLQGDDHRTLRIR